MPDRTPPEIVADADDPAFALSAFIAQELEHWGFDVRGEDTPTLEVTVGDGPAFLLIEIQQVVARG